MKAESSSSSRHYYQQSDVMNSASERSSRSKKNRKCVGTWTLSKRGSARGAPKEDSLPPQQSSSDMIEYLNNQVL